ncbi:hypothetical protein YPPY95_4531, partial [Yersinia pestis PY-95]
MRAIASSSGKFFTKLLSNLIIWISKL